MKFMHRYRRFLSVFSLLTFLLAGSVTPASAIYNPKTGKFMQRDPNGVGVVLQPGLSYNAANPIITVSLAHELQYAAGMNFYEYLRSNPNKYADPSGLLPDWIGEFLYATTGGDDSWWGRFLESDTSQDVADAAELVGGAILIFTPGAGAGAASLASKIGRFPRLQAFGRSVWGLASRFRGVHSTTLAATRVGFAGGLALGFYDGLTNRRTGTIGFLSAGAAGSSGIAATLANLLLGTGTGNQLAVGFGGLGGLFVGNQLGRAGGRLTAEIIDAIYEDEF